jgi:molybdenum cofactor biosynthesis enzyme MoaA
MKKKAKGYYGGKYRMIEYEILRDNKEVNILCIYLDEVELEVGDEMAQIEGDRLRTKKYSGEMPSEIYYYNIIDVEGVVIAPTRKVICARCQKVYIIGEESYQKLGFCSEKCEQKNETKIAKSAMKAAVNRGNKNSRVLS